MNLRFALTLFALTLFTLNSSAVITVGGFNFDDNAFADTLISSSGIFTVGGGATSVEEAVVGSDLSDFAFSFSPGAFLEIGFTDNVIINDAGADLVIFELGVQDKVQLSLTLGGTKVSKMLTNTGLSAGMFSLNAAAWDLGTDFGLSPGDSVSSLVLGVDTITTTISSMTVPSITGIGALNSAAPGSGNPVGNSGGAAVPEPSTYAMMVLGLAGLGIYKRRKK